MPARSISVRRCNGCAALGRNELTWPRTLVPAAPAISFPSSRNLNRVTICRELRHTDQLISLITVGQIDGKKRTGRRLGSNEPSPACPVPRGIEFAPRPASMRVMNAGHSCRDPSVRQTRGILFMNLRMKSNSRTSDCVEISFFRREPSPVCPAGGWGRNADALFICASKRLQTMDLRTDVDRDAGALDQCATVQRLRRSRNEMRPTRPRALVPAAPAIAFPSSRKVTPCHHLPRTKTYRSTH